MSFVGAPAVFQFDEVLPGIGTIAPGAAVRFGDATYFLSERGFIALQAGTQAGPSGVGKIDQRVLADLDLSNLHRISAVEDPTGQRIFWAYSGQGNSEERHNKMVGLDTAQ